MIQNDDTISRQDALDAVKEAVISAEWEYAEKALENLPSAQPVGTLLHDSGTDYAHGYADGYKQGKAESEIVRCKNCKLFGEPKCLMYFDGYDWAEPDGYCHMAERREDGQNA